MKLDAYLLQHALKNPSHIALEESKQEGSEGQALLSEVEKITQSISDLEDKVALSEKSSFSIKIYLFLSFT